MKPLRARGLVGGVQALQRDLQLAEGPAVDEIPQEKTSLLPVIRGDFGQSWELWPVSLARFAAAMREAATRK